MTKPSQKKYSEIFEKLSPDLLKLAVSEETPDKISEICVRNGTEDGEQIREIAYRIGQVLLGRLSPDDFQETIEKEAKLFPSIAKKISEEIALNIFTPVQDSLAKVYEKEVILPSKSEEKATPQSEEKPAAPPGKDTYREPVE